MDETSRYIEEIANRITKLAVTSRMARVPLEKQLDPFLGFPVRIETVRLPSKSTRLTFSCGKTMSRRVVTDQSSKSIHQAARTLVRKVLSEVSLVFVLNN